MNIGLIGRNIRTGMRWGGILEPRIRMGGILDPGGGLVGILEPRIR